MIRLLASLAVAAVAGAAMTDPVAAQGTLGGQGFGYPLGGLSTRSLATGGASGEFDDHAARNPAAIILGSRRGVFFQYDPEFRELEQGAQRDRTVTPRFAAIGILFPVKSRFALGITSHSLLDRTWATVIRSGQRLGPDSVLFTESNRSSGGLNETRLSLAFAPFNGRVAMGAGLHLITGENRLTLRRQFDDSLRYGTLLRNLTLAYSGVAASAGVVVAPVTWFSAAASVRQGGDLRLRVADTLRSSASVPNRLGVAVRFDAIPGVSLMGSADRTEWSGINGLGSEQADGNDVWEYAVGADFASQRSRRALGWTYSVGYRVRDLPFAVSGAIVRERIVSGGTSTPIAGGRATMDLALQRATREAAGSLSERAWMLSVGLTIRP
ncbi:MAG: hypothetical protein IT361_16150 [Gemmatimonadaceae bacterium]|nr:hypothetical protein [Gemmatimonadaceae bacterium]